MKRVRWRWHGIVLVAGLIVACQDAASQNAGGEEVHPAKQVYVDMASWAETAPGQVQLKNFTPFRAVYERHYRDMNGQLVKDRVIITAENVAWGPRGAIMVGLIDTGSLEYDDTNARAQIRYFAADDMSLLFQITPAPGMAKDYGLIRVEDDGAHVTMVKTATGETEHKVEDVPERGFGAPGAWLFGSMAPEEGMNIRLHPYFAPASSSILGGDPSRVIGRKWVETPAGDRYEAWVLERPLGGLTSPRLMHTYVIDRPPYLLGKAPMDADTGETSEIGSLRLLEFQTFPEGRE